MVKSNISFDYRSVKYTFAFLLLLSSGSVFAEDELFFEMPIVLSANRLEQLVFDAAVSISIIDRETIEATGARTIPEILRLIPGMQIGYSGNEFGDIPKYVVTHHGHSDQYSKQMQVLIDGRSIYEPLIGGIMWKTIPINIDDIERIEVSRGPNLATYGANSFQAAINIITRTAAEDQGSYVRTNLGNHDIADLTYRYGGNNGKLDYRITASTLNDDGLDSANDNDYPDDTNSNKIDYRLDYQINNHNTLTYQGGYGDSDQQADRNHEDVLPTERTVETTHFFQYIRLENAINAENTIQLQYYYNKMDQDDKYNSDPISISPYDTFTLYIDDDVETERHNLEFTHFIYPDKNIKLVWGLNAQLDHVVAPQALGTYDKVNHEQYRAVANIEWHVDQSNIINFGGLVEKNTYSATELSPRLSLTHTFNTHHKVRIGISQAVRSPFVYEERADNYYSEEITVGGLPVGTLREQVTLGNPDLKNEKIISHELAYYGSFLNSSLQVDARLFHDEITDYIDTIKEEINDPTIDNYDNTAQVFRNPINSDTNGLEFALDYRIDPTLRLIATGAIINISSNSEAISLSAPQHSYSIFLTKRFNEKYNTSLGYYFVDEFKWTDARPPGVAGVPTTDFYSTDEYHTLDIRLSRNLAVGKTHGSASIVMKNLLGDYSDYQKAPRNSTAPLVIQDTVAYLELRLSY
jgi:iron complex outermembrane recepter protein